MIKSNKPKTVFEAILTDGHDEGFIPQKECSDPRLSDLAPVFDQTSEESRDERVKQLAARIARGEELFHPDEQTIEPMEDRNVSTLIENSRGYSAAGGTKRCSERAPQ